MNEGTVRLWTPAEWGNLQETDPKADNYIKVNAPRSRVSPDEISYGDHNVWVPLVTVGYNDAIEFVLSNVEAQKQVGLAEFRVDSAGGPSDILERLKGIPLPKDKDDKNITDPYELLGEVYVSYIALDADVDNQAAVTAATGRLRLEVVAGEGGTGEAELLEIVRTDSGLQDYLDEDGELISDRQVHAGDDEIYLAFKYTPVETIDNGELKFTVPDDWSPPQEDSSNKPGYTEIEDTAASLGAADFENRVITIPIDSIDSSGSIEIHYGVGSLGAEAPDVKKTSEFRFAVKGTSGTFRNIGAVDVEVRSQASGRGMASVATGMVAEDETTPTVYAGADGSITITYTSIGQIVNGRVKLTVPEALTGGADGDGVTASDISVSGDAKYGGVEDLDLDANADITKDDVLVSGVNLDHDDEFTFTYEGMMPETTQEDLSFTVALDGGEGPGEVDEGMPVPLQVGDALIVKVLEAEAGFWYGFDSPDG